MLSFLSESKHFSLHQLDRQPFFHNPYKLFQWSAQRDKLCLAERGWVWRACCWCVRPVANHGLDEGQRNCANLLELTDFLKGMVLPTSISSLDQALAPCEHGLLSATTQMLQGL